MSTNTNSDDEEETVPPPVEENKSDLLGAAWAIQQLNEKLTAIQKDHKEFETKLSQTVKLQKIETSVADIDPMSRDMVKRNKVRSQLCSRSLVHVLDSFESMKATLLTFMTENFALISRQRLVAARLKTAARRALGNKAFTSAEDMQLSVLLDEALAPIVEDFSNIIHSSFSQIESLSTDLLKMRLEFARRNSENSELKKQLAVSMQFYHESHKHMDGMKSQLLSRRDTLDALRAAAEDEHARNTQQVLKLEGTITKMQNALEARAAGTISTFDKNARANRPRGSFKTPPSKQLSSLHIPADSSPPFSPNPNPNPNPDIPTRPATTEPVRSEQAYDYFDEAQRSANKLIALQQANTALERRCSLLEGQLATVQSAHDQLTASLREMHLQVFDLEAREQKQVHSVETQTMEGEFTADDPYCAAYLRRYRVRVKEVPVATKSKKTIVHRQKKHKTVIASRKMSLAPLPVTTPHSSVGYALREAIARLRDSHTRWFVVGAEGIAVEILEAFFNSHSASLASIFRYYASLEEENPDCILRMTLTQLFALLRHCGLLSSDNAPFHADRVEAIMEDVVWPRPRCLEDWEQQELDAQWEQYNKMVTDREHQQIAAEAAAAKGRKKSGTLAPLPPPPQSPVPPVPDSPYESAEAAKMAGLNLGQFLELLLHLAIALPAEMCAEENVLRRVEVLLIVHLFPKIAPCVRSDTVFLPSFSHYLLRADAVNVFERHAQCVSRLFACFATTLPTRPLPVVLLPQFMSFLARAHLINQPLSDLNRRMGCSLYLCSVDTVDVPPLSRMPADLTLNDSWMTFPSFKIVIARFSLARAPLPRQHLSRLPSLLELLFSEVLEPLAEKAVKGKDGAWHIPAVDSYAPVAAAETPVGGAVAS